MLRITRTAVALMIAAGLAAAQASSPTLPGSRASHLGRLSVRILAHDGRALGSTRVCIKQTKVYHLPREDHGRETYVGGPGDTLWVKTNASGRVDLTLQIEPPGREGKDREGEWELFYNASAWVPGEGASYPVAVLVQPDRDSNAIFRLVPMGEVVGRIIDVHGQPVTGVTVIASAHQLDFLEMFPTMTDWVLTSRSDPEGTYRFELVPGSYRLTVTGSAVTPVLTDSSPGEIEVESNKTIHQDLRVMLDHTLRGQVVDAQGRPVDGDSLNAAGGGCGLEIGHDGRFELDLRPIPMVHSGPPRLEKDFTLWVTNFREDGPVERGRKSLAGSAHIDLSRPLPHDVEVRLQRTSTLSFDVRQGSGQERVPYINVYFFRAGEFRPPEAKEWPWKTGGRKLDLPCRSYADTSGTGVLEIQGVPPGVYELWVWHGGVRGARATVSGDHQVLVRPGSRVQLDPMKLVSLPRLTGSVTGADSTLKRAHAFRLYYASIAGGPVHDNAEAGFSIDAGRFHVRLSEAGRFRGIVRAPRLFREVDYASQGGTVSPVFEFETVDGKDTAIDLELHVAPRFRVEVRHPHGVLGLGHYVKIEPLDPAIPLPSLLSPVSIYGETESAQLPPGAYRVTVLAPGNENPLVSQRVELNDTEAVRVLRLEIP